MNMDWADRDIFPFSAIVGQDRMIRALILIAICPAIGGLLVRGEKGTGKSTAVRALASVLPRIETVTGCRFNCDPGDKEGLCIECRTKLEQGLPLAAAKKRVNIVDLPLGCTEDMVLGSMELEAAIKNGTVVFEPGLLAAAHRGILYVDEINLLNDHIVDVILDSAGMGVNIVEREGISCAHRSEFILIGTMNPEEGELRPQLLDRFGICVEVKGMKDPDKRVRLIRQREHFDTDRRAFFESWRGAQDALEQKIAMARNRFDRARISEDMARRISQLALDASVAGHRADIIMRMTALAIACYEGRVEVAKQDVDEAADLVLLHRARTPPQSSQKDQKGDEEDDGRSPENKHEQNHRPENKEARDPGRRLDGDREKKGNRGEQKGKTLSGVNSGGSLFSVGEPFKVKDIQLKRDHLLRKGSGRRSRTRTSSKAGRYIMSTSVRSNNDFALDATLRAAAPYQPHRAKSGVAVAIQECDIREKLREKRIGNFIVFVVDASGSMGAGRRMIETKGAVLSLLMDAYQKRDKVAMVAFKGDHAEILLPPTSSTEMALKCLEDLPTGGKTPLCHGISLGYGIIQSHLRKDPNIYPWLVLISDGKANVGLYGGKPMTEAMELAEEIGLDSRINTAVVDVEALGLITFGLARRLSVQMGARYLRVEDLKADTLVKVLREDLLA